LPNLKLTKQPLKPMHQNRRNFIKTTATATAAGLFAPLTELVAKETIGIKAAAGYELLFMATDWGFSGTIDEFCVAAKKEGYEGIELWWAVDNPTAQQSLYDALKKHQLQVGFLCGAGQPKAKPHLETFMKKPGCGVKQCSKTIIHQLPFGKGLFYLRGK
jgi:hypothetical protein